MDGVIEFSVPGNRILAIDPGNEKTAYALYTYGGFPEFDIVDNHQMLFNLPQYAADVVVIERVECMGMAVGKSVFQTCEWIGRFIQKAFESQSVKVCTIGRRNVKMHMCNSMRAKDGNIRQAVMDRYGSTRERALGTKKKPGPLYGASQDIWSAMAIAITASESTGGLEWHSRDIEPF